MGIEEGHMLILLVLSFVAIPASLTANVARNITRGHPQVVALVNASVNGTLSFEGDDDIGSGIPWQNLTLSQCKT